MHLGYECFVHYMLRLHVADAREINGEHFLFSDQVWKLVVLLIQIREV